MHIKYIQNCLTLRGICQTFQRLVIVADMKVGQCEKCTGVKREYNSQAEINKTNLDLSIEREKEKRKRLS